MPLTFDIINLELDLSILTAMEEELDAVGMKVASQRADLCDGIFPKPYTGALIRGALENFLNRTRREVGAQERTWE